MLLLKFAAISRAATLRQQQHTHHPRTRIHLNARMVQPTKKPSHQGSTGGFASPTALFVILLASVATTSLVQYGLDHGYLAASPASPTKPFATFEAFYPHYLSEHAQRGTKLAHFIGTTLMALYVAINPYLVTSFVSAGAVGYALFPLLRHLETGLVEMAAMFITFFAVGRVLTGSSRTALTPMLIGYGFAWVGHFFVEHNKPATFIYPLFSLLGDFRMFFDVATGRIPY